MINNFPKELIDASLSLGMTYFQFIYFIFLPYYKIDLLYLVNFLLIYVFSIFDVILIISPYPQTISTALYNYYFSFDFNHAKILILYTLIVVILLFIFLKKLEKRIKIK
jgi:ABC-type Fe3+ transport system permease subunit